MKEEKLIKNDKSLDEQFVTGRANFVKINVNFVEDKLLTTIIRTFTLFPIPLVFIKMVASVFIKQINMHSEFKLSKNELMQLINSAKGLEVDVQTKDITIKIKIL